MFGMGTELSLKDFANVVRMPKGIIVGVVCHYVIMPLIGFSLATLFNFPKEIAAGIILVGCCPSGLASNVMCYLAKGNLALSVSVTTISTMNDYPANKPVNEQTDSDRVYPGDGAAPLKQILQDLKTMGGTKVLSLELFNAAYWKEDALSVATTGLKKMQRLVEEVLTTG